MEIVNKELSESYEHPKIALIAVERAGVVKLTGEVFWRDVDGIGKPY